MTPSHGPATGGEYPAAPYRLHYLPSGGDASVERAFTAADDEAARKTASRMIAEAHGAPDALVLLDHRTGHVTVGAGYWSRHGTFTLQQTQTDQGDADGDDRILS